MRIHGRKINAELLKLVEDRILIQRPWFDSAWIAGGLESIPGGMSTIRIALQLDESAKDLQGIMHSLTSIVKNILQQLRKRGLVEWNNSIRRWRVIRND